jgi:hypothetical protein
MKICSKCNKDLNNSLFYKDRSKLDGLSSYCKPCRKERTREYREINKQECKARNRKYYKENKDSINAKRRKERIKIVDSVGLSAEEYNIHYRRTQTGFLNNSYATQKRSCIEREHEKPQYTKQELKQWLESNKDFTSIWKRWVESEYKTELKPSIDRLDSNKTYSLDNIQVVTWEENRRLGRIYTTEKQRKSVLKRDIKTGSLLCEYLSINEACRQTGVDTSSITKNLKGERKTAGGYLWEYK